MADESDGLKQVARVRAHVIPELGPGDVERLVAVAATKRERRRIRGSLGVGLAVGAASASVLWLLVRVASGGADVAGLAFSARGAASVQPPAALTAAAQSPSAARTARTWVLSDRSRATALAPATDIVVEQDSPSRASLRLERGRARFEVTRRPERAFQVRAGTVTVDVIGTVFDVEVVADRIGVTVEQGAVEVAWGLGRKRLVAGESGWFPPLVLSEGDARVSVAPPASGASPATAMSTAAQASAASSAPAAGPERGEAVAGAGATSARELLAESDAARTRGEPGRGAELLRRVLREHPNDARAPLAAFTLGRLLLNELGRPREAAAVFHELQVRAPGGQFAEDALAREVEAWKQASEPGRARSAAERYLERYPAGRHLRRVKALAGLE